MHGVHYYTSHVFHPTIENARCTLLPSETRGGLKSIWEL
ncbi:hypothetical protein A2U01_0007481, partial [Trifolium medium]|nr:hypothetical protein [Trifolium medium]